LMRRLYKREDEKRMVVLLRPEEYGSWLHAPAEQLGSFLQQYPSGALQAVPAPKPSASRSRTLAAPSSLF
jgi:putative SOS response-associated peptidase YedK